MIRRAVAVTAFIAVVLAGAVVDRAESLDAQRADAVAEAVRLAGSVRTAEMRTPYLVDAIDQAQQGVEERDAVLAVRPAFAASIATLGAALSRAEGKVDVSAHRAAALSVQQTVLAERRDPEVVTGATATIEALTAKIGDEVSVWEVQQRTGGSGPAWQGSGPEGYARVRAALDRVGGAGVGLYESASCAGGSAPACANSNGYIKYRADVATWGTDRLNWAMAHELAHIFQFQVWGALTSSASYQALFGGNPESLANCMAVVRGFPGSVSCGQEQQEWASGIWVGAVR